MRALVASLFITSLVVTIGVFAALSTTTAQQANPPCVVSILNRTAFVQPDGSWQIDNIPSNFGLVRARMTCVQNGQTISGQSDFFQIVPGVITQIDAPIILGVVEPIPESIDITPSAPTLTTANLSVQLTVTATFPDSSTKDITLREEGTNYTSSNSNIATVSENGLVSAILSGNALVSAINEGVVSSIQVAVLLSGDSDGDGLPDDYETANGLNPNDPVDATEDQDSDGLSALQEFLRGTDPHVADTDGDTILDGEEVIAGVDGFITNPLLADTDGDQIRDALEISVGTDPNNKNSFNFGAVLANIDVEPDGVNLIVNTVVSQATAQIIVTGNLIDGTTANLTKKSTGTTYLSSNLLVVNFGVEDGKIFAGQDGSATITVSNGGFNQIIPVTVSTFTPLALSRTDLPATGFGNNIDVVEDTAYIAHGANGLLVYALGNRQAPTLLGNEDTPGNANDVKVLGNHAYVADGASGLQIIDISDPNNPSIVGDVNTPGEAWDVVVPGDGFAYIADGASGLQIIDISDPTNPVIVGDVDTPGTAKGVDVNGNFAVIADGAQGIQVINVSDRTDPNIVGSVPVGGDARDLVARNNIAYVATFVSDGFRVVDFNVPTNPVHIATETVGNDILQDVALSGRFAFGADVVRPNGVPVIDIGDNNNPLLRDVMNFISLGDANGLGIDADDNFIYLLAGSITENGTTGGTQLYIGQFLSLNDPFGIAPTVELTSPVDGGTIFERGFALVTANATDDVFVSSVTFTLDGVPVFTDFGEPFIFPFLVPEGSDEFTFGASAIDLGGNIGVADDVTVSVEAPTERLIATASVGTATNPSLPSANPGQTIIIESDAIGVLTSGTQATFQTINDSGVQSTTTVTVSTVTPDGKRATVVVPNSAQTGSVIITGVAANPALQIVPRLNSFSNNDYAPGQNLTLSGAGFIEGGITVNFTGVSVVDPDTGTGTINVFSTNTQMNVTIPAGAGASVSVVTTGGTSNSLIVGPGSFDGIVATASLGTPANPADASALVGQTITVLGTSLKSNTNVIFPVIDDAGNAGTTGVRIANINADGTSATVVVPTNAITGNLSMLGALGVFRLQIVPRITSFSDNDFTFDAPNSRSLTLIGGGFVEGDTTVDFGNGASVIDPDTTANTIDVFSLGTRLNVPTPLNASGRVFVTTAGGSSDTFVVGPTSFTGVSSTSSIGVPADPGLPSAIIGQGITLAGSGFGSSTNVKFPMLDDSGTPTEARVQVTSVNADGTEALVVVPTGAMTGIIEVPGARGAPLPIPNLGTLTEVYSNDFETSAGSEWNDQSRTTTTGTDIPETSYLGRFSNESIILTLTGLPPHQSVVVETDLFTLDSWDGGVGSSGNDRWGFFIEGRAERIADYSFPADGASTDFPDPADVTGEFGPIATFSDRLYRNVTHAFRHTGDTLRIAFFGTGLQGVADESWGLDNVRVLIDNTPVAETGQFLQIVPRITSVSDSDYTFDAPTSRSLTISGGGFIEGRSTVNFGNGVSIADVNFGSNGIDVFSIGTSLNVPTPLDATGTVSITTAGGTSNDFNAGPISFTGINSVAATGTPADAGLPSAIVGQDITITGSGFGSSTNVKFPVLDDSGIPTEGRVRVTSVNVDGTEAVVNVPSGAVTGIVEVPGARGARLPVPDLGTLTEVYSNDFESGVGAEWNTTTTTTTTGTDIAETTYLGRFSNNDVILTLTGLPPHQSIVVETDLFTIDSWDGGFNNDRWGFFIDGRGERIADYSFPAAGASTDYPIPADVIGEFGPSDAFSDRLYRDVTHAFRHTGDTLRVRFFGTNLSSISDESWGLDNIRVLIDNNPVAETGQFLQIVPRITSFSNSDYRPSGTSRTLQIGGSGFVEGGISVDFGNGIITTDPDVSFNIIDVFSGATQMNVPIPSGAEGTISVTTNGGTSDTFDVGPTSFTGINSVANFGTPANAGLPSSNVGSTITVLGSGFQLNTNVVFTTTDDSGNPGSSAVRVSGVNAAGTEATVVVPNTATTGAVTIPGTSNSFDLQIVPRLTSHNNSDFRTGITFSMFGSGFVEGGMTINFGASPVVDPDTSFTVIDVFSSGTQLNLNAPGIPANPGGLVTIETSGGTSNPLQIGPESFTDITTVADFGTPASGSLPSANAGQTITIVGSEFRSNTRLIFPTISDTGVPGTAVVALSNFSADMTSATAVVPAAATTGVVSMHGTSSSIQMQIVPRLTDFGFTTFAAGQTLNLTGGGFIEGDTTVSFDGVLVPDPDTTTTTLDVSNFNRAIAVVIPASPGTAISVETAGGTSNTLDVDLPNIDIFTSPRNTTSIVEGKVVRITANALDDVGVDSVEFLVDGAPPPAFSGVASTLTVDGRANVFGAGHSSNPGGGVSPPSVSFPAAPGQTMRVLSATGNVSGFTNSCAFNGPDGAQVCGGSTNVGSSGGVSGLTHSNRTMFLAGVFLNDSEPADPPPTRLDVSTFNNQTTISPLLNQTFFIGDGLTSNGELQNFVVPTGATRLFLGFVETTFFNTGAGPSSYNDNGGSLSVSLVVSDTFPSPLVIAEEASGSRSETVRLFFTAPDFVPAGDNTITIEAIATDNDANSTAATPIVLEVIEPTFAINAVANSGSPLDAGLPSANIGQTITLNTNFPAFDSLTLVQIPSTDDNGTDSIAWTRVDGASVDQTSATITLFGSASTGSLVVEGVGSEILQVVPTVTTFSNNSDFINGQFLRLHGSGFIEGASTVNLGAASVSDQDTTTTNFNVHSNNTQLDFTIPDGSDGLISVTTEGGTSDTFSVGPESFDGIVATAPIGTPTDPGLPSANAGQVITVLGTALRTNTRVIFSSTGNDGVQGVVSVRVNSVSADGTEASITVPLQASTGSVRLFGTDETFDLQIVPRLFSSFSNSDFEPGQTIRLDGRGFIEGQTTIGFGSVNVIDPDASSTIVDVFSTNTQMNVTIPSGVGSEITVTTPGGVSNTVELGATSFTGIIAAAFVGTPVDAGSPSANAGQLITITGSGFRTNTNVQFLRLDTAGVPGTITTRVTDVNVDGTEATVVVPLEAHTGAVRVIGTDETVNLQIVPRLFSSFSNSDFAPGQNIRLDGRGFIEGQTTISFGNVDVVDPDTGSGTVDVFSSNTFVNVTIPNGVGSAITVTTPGGVSNTVDLGATSFTGIIASAFVGTPANAGLPSANAGQLITITGSGLRTNTNVVFQQVDNSGVPSTTAARVSGVNFDGTEATVVVPLQAVTGTVGIFGTDDTQSLQITPRLFGSFSNNDFAPGQNIRLDGRGFVEGQITITFGDVDVVDPDTSFSIVDVFTSNTSMNVTIPEGAGGEIKVTTVGGESNTVAFGPTSFTGIIASAAVGTPADPGLPSANAEQLITITGSDLRSNTNVVFQNVDASGIPGTVNARVSGVNASGTEATVVVPLEAVTDTVRLHGASESFNIQIVPRLFSNFTMTSFTPGTNLRLNGRGFVEGGTTVNFGSVAVVDPDAGSSTIDVFSSNTGMNVSIPLNGDPEVTLVTAGGTSNSLALLSDIAGAPPEVTITSPVIGSDVFEGGVIDITATAVDDVFLKSVRFAVLNPLFEEIAVFTDLVAPYEFQYFVPFGSTSQLVLDATAVDLAGNVGDADDVIVNVGTSAASISGVVATGTPTNAALPSANIGQTINLTGGVGAFTATTDVTFPISDDNGAKSTLDVTVATVAPDGSTATVVVPSMAITGGLTIEGVDGNLALQVVPTITTFVNTDFRPGVNLQLNGTGFAEGATTVEFGPVSVVDPNNGTSILNVFNNGASLNVTIPGGALSQVAVTTAGGTSNSILVGPQTFTGIVASANFGTPANAELPSANVGQSVTVTGTGFSGNTNVSFSTLSDSGVLGATNVRVANVSGGTSATVTVPTDATTGPVSVFGTSSSFDLQIVPRLTAFTNADFRPSGSSRNLQMFGSGFAEGDMTVNFGSTAIVDPDIGSNTIDVFSTNTSFNVIIPSAPEPNVTVTTAGGTSDPFEVGPTSFTGIVSTAAFGTPANAGLPSANVGFLITINGTGLKDNTNVTFRTRDDNGILGVQFVRVSSVNVDGTEATVVVPTAATTGLVSMPGVTSTFQLRIVPRLTSFTNNDFAPSGASRNLQMFGSGFDEGAMTVHFGAVDVADPDISFNTIDVFSSSTSFNVVIPNAPEPIVTVTTAGGTSNAIEVGPTSFTGIISTAVFGTPANVGLPSANAGFTITVTGTGLKDNTNLTFTTRDDSGVLGSQSVRVSGVNIGGTEATVVVPTAATTGIVSMPGVTGTFQLQIVPRLTSFSNNDFTPSGASRNLQMFGSGFDEGAMTVHFGAVDVVDPDISSNTIDVFSTSTSFNTIIPSNPGGDVSVTTVGGTSNAIEVGPTSFTGIVATAAFGTPANVGLPSANAGFTITVTGTGLNSNTNVTFTTRDDSGILGSQSVRVSGVNISGTEATVVVPTAATTGIVSMPGVTGTFQLQIVPRLTSFSNNDFTPSGASRNLQMFGSGFDEGAMTVHFGAVDVADPDISFNTIDVFSTSTSFNTIIPSNPGGEISVTTAGGTSNAIEVGPTSFTGIVATADFGAPTNGATPSANVGQLITLTGTGFRSNSNVTFVTRDDSGILGSQSVRVSGVNVDGTEATVVVPTAAKSGLVRVPGNSDSFEIQIVPRITSFSYTSLTVGSNLRINGSGFEEGNIAVNFGAVTVVDPGIGSSTIDVFSTSTSMNVTIPAGAGNVVNVLTSGGTSNSVDLLLPNVIVTSPRNGDAVASGSTIAVSASAFDNTGIQSVEFLVNNVVEFIDNTSPFEFSLMVPEFDSVAGNTLTIKARATDTNSNVTDSSEVSVTIVEPVFDIDAVANFGTPNNAGLASANAGQTIVLTANYRAFTGSTVVSFPTIADNGSVGTTGVQVSSVNADGTSATVVVPNQAVTGVISVSGISLPNLIENPGADALPDGTLLFDSFETENGGVGVLNYSSFANWDRSGGTVDLIGNGFHDGHPGNGLFIDMDGSSFNAGRLQSKATFDLQPGDYELRFDIAGGAGTNTMTVALADVFSEDFTLIESSPFATISRTITVATATSGTLSFDHAGGDNNGLKLDNVRLIEVDSVPVGSVIPGWEQVAGTWDIKASEPKPDGGSAYFSDGNVAVAELRQDIDVSDLAVNIDAGNQTFLFEGVVRSLDESVDDTAAIVVEYRNAANTNVLASFNSGDIASVSAWQDVVDLRTAPVGTRIIRVRLISTRNSGTSNDGYFDSLVLRAIPSSGRPDFLQVVPRLTTFSNNSDFAPGQFIRLHGSGFVEGGSTVNFGSSSVVDPDTGSNVINVHTSSTRLDLNIPANPGPVVTVETAGGTSEPLTIGPTSLTGIIATADFGIPSDPSTPSANTGQVITITGSDFRSTTVVTFPTVSDSGAVGVANVRVSSLNVDGTEATVVVPSDAATGQISLVGVSESFTLQIVPRLTTFSNNSDFVPGQFIRLRGSGFVEGGATVNFGSSSVVDPDTGSGVINVHASSTGLDLDIPADPGADVTVQTAGGTSNTLTVGPTSFTNVIGAANNGAPADPSTPSANVGQIITITGSGFRSITNVTFPIVDDNGVPGVTNVRLNSLNAAGTEATVFVPTNATTGVLSMHGVEGANLLQNANAEEPLVGGEIPGWTEAVGDDWKRRASNPSPHEGAAYFFAGAPVDAGSNLLPEAELIQDVDVSPLAGEIAAGTQVFAFEGFARTFSQNPSDTSRIIIEYRDATDVLDSFDTGQIVSTSRWQRVFDARTAPVGTETIRVRLISTRNNGDNNDGYFDSLSLMALSPGDSLRTLQIVPHLTTFSNNNDYSSGQFLRLVGGGFIEGDVTVHLGSVSLVDPDGGSGSINVHNSGSSLDVQSIPSNAGAVITIETDGGLSNPLAIGPTSFTGITASANFGTPLDAGTPSANVGQLITVAGTDIRTNTNVSFPSVNDNGVAGTTHVRVTGVNAARTVATVVVPNSAVTGQVSLFGAPETFQLQIVPRITSFNTNLLVAGNNLRLGGSGFVEGGITVNFGVVSVTDPDTSGTTINVFSSGTSLDVTIPSGAEPNVSVTTAGGTSNVVVTQIFGIVIPPGQQNLSLLPGVTAQSSTDFSVTFNAPKGIDNNLNTGWFTANNDPAPSYTIEFPSAVTVHSLQIVPGLPWLSGFNFITGQFQMFDDLDAQLFDSGVVAFSGGQVNVPIDPSISDVAKVVFTASTWESIEPGFGEFAVVGASP